MPRAPGEYRILIPAPGGRGCDACAREGAYLDEFPRRGPDPSRIFMRYLCMTCSIVLDYAEWVPQTVEAVEASARENRHLIVLEDERSGEHVRVEYATLQRLADIAREADAWVMRGEIVEVSS